jgi:hypothetical protein
MRAAAGRNIGAEEMVPYDTEPAAGGSISYSEGFFEDYAFTLEHDSSPVSAD